ncbi:MAG: TetR/AcrR family transcriptional regulator [Terracidiphilus sp.]|jgi:AcrR family transcriptional regulator
MKTKKTIRKSKQPARLLKTRVIEEKTTRERILEAARELFAEMPYDKVGISGIVKRAGIAQGTFYIHFDSKQEVIHALADEILGRLQRIIDRVARETRTTIEFIAKMMKEAPEALLPYRALMRIFDPEMLFFQRETTPPSAFRTPLLDTLIRLIRRDQRAGVVPADVNAEIAARFVVSIFDRIERDGTREDPTFPLQDLQEQAMLFLSRGLLQP